MRTIISWLAGTTTFLRGGFYVDQTGVFSNHLIVVTGGQSFEGGEVWRIDAAANAVRLADLSAAVNPHLEGVITLSNDVARWGPWAGKIVTGAESATPPRIYAIATNGAVATNYLGIAPEDFDLIPPNQDLYTCRMEKLARQLFTNYWGDLLIVQSGETGPLITQSGDSFSLPFPYLFIVHWDSTNFLFHQTRIPYNRGFEHVTFAPIDLPSAPP